MLRDKILKGIDEKMLIKGLKKDIEWIFKKLIFVGIGVLIFYIVILVYVIFFGVFLGLIIVMIVVFVVFFGGYFFLYFLIRNF